MNHTQQNKYNGPNGLYLQQQLWLWPVLRLPAKPERCQETDSRCGYLTETELGIIGSALFFTYAIGKFVNGFLADRVNVRYLMAGGLFVATLVNAALGFAVPFGRLSYSGRLNGWFQSVGGPCSVIALNRWFTEKERGTVYGFWSASHNIGEALTFIFTSFIVGALDGSGDL